MATTKNITMKQFNGTDYDTLYPKTVYNQVSGVAPAGYGLGSGNGKSISNCNDAIQNGWYVTGVNTTNGPVDPANSAALNYLTLLVSSGAERIRQIAFVATQNYYAEATRYSSDSGTTWAEWEWVNPPMKLGVEYRTTERYQGKPVYVKLVDCGALPNSTSKSISISSDTAVKCFDVVTGTNSSGMVLPTACFGGINLDREVAITSNGSSILIVTNFDGSSYTKTYVLVKYTKTTD